MVVKVKPFVIKCQACGWSKVVSPKSDAVLELSNYVECPSCHKNKLIIESLKKGILSFIYEKCFHRKNKKL